MKHVFLGVKTIKNIPTNVGPQMTPLLSVIISYEHYFCTPLEDIC